MQGTGIITKGPYIRNCTNFIQDSIGAKVDGFNADEGDKISTIGVQGSFNVDSYTQFNQGGIGVSITNGALCSISHSSLSAMIPQFILVMEVNVI